MDPYEYEALHDIYIDGVAAFRTGDGVPKDHLKAHGLKVGEDVQARKTEARKADEPAKKS